MAAVPFWMCKRNNATSNITRAYFGLPIEPLTAINIKNADENTDDPRMEIERDIPGLQKELSEGTPLDFLDEYTESLRGKPGIRGKSIFAAVENLTN